MSDADTESTFAEGGGRSVNRAEVIHDDIVKAILEHRLRPGTKLGEDEVGAIYGVSRTIVRAALQLLAHEGIVVIEKNRGAFVAHPSIDEAREVFEARKLIEAVIAARAAERCDEEGAAALTEHGALERRAQREGDESAAIRLTGEFHLLLARIADHRILENFLRELVARSSLIILLYRNSRVHSCNTDHHDQLAQAISQGRIVDAVRSMGAHLDEIESGLELVETMIPAQPLADVLGLPGAGRSKAL